MGKIIVSVSLDPELIDWIKENSDNISSFVNQIVQEKYRKTHLPSLKDLGEEINELNQRIIFCENKYWQVLTQETMLKQIERDDETKKIEFEKQQRLERIKSLVIMAKENIPEIQEIYKEFKEKNIQITDTKWFLSKVDHIKSLHSGIKLGIVQLREIMLNLEID